ncbi:DUF456 domain-containing protein [Floridanema evergladense]|uniref:DUF456 domain-containing protein n=1 Tax=Floridaenema evergladense BLCC-F167 TaxID=3153639 RepID=A0ABV4WML8_9CYAN
MIILYWLLIVLMVVGIIGALVPGIPGASLILVSIFVWGAIDGFTQGVWIALATALAVLLLSLGIDFVATYWGGKQAGASNWGQIGAFVGLTLGFFGLLPALPFGGPLLGILIGPLLGAIIGEFLYRRDLEFEPRIKLAAQAGVGIVVGNLVGRLIQGVLAIASVIVFIFTTWPPGVT